MANINEPLLQLDGSCECDYQNILPDQDLIKLLKTMIFNRQLESRLMLLHREGRIRFSLTSTGEEAITIGAAYCLNDTDPMFLSYRELGAILYRNVPLHLIMNQFFGNAQDLNKGRQMPVHYCFRDYNIPSVSAPVGTQLPHACGFAYASKLKQEPHIALAFFGEGTASGNDAHAALNFSGVLQSPAIFILRNNGYAISTPESAQTAATNLVDRAKGYGIHGEQIDGNDMLLVIQTLKSAVNRARHHHQPTLIEAMTYRMGAHSSSDDPSAYRTSEETHQWASFDPLVRLLNHAKWRQLWTDKDHSDFEQEISKKIGECISECEPLPHPSIDSLFDDVYHTMPPHLQSQKLNYHTLINKLKEQHP